MELFFHVLLQIFVSTLLYLVFSTKKKKTNLPPGPLSIPLLGNLLWLRYSISDLETILKNLFKKHGSIVTLRTGSHIAIFISDRVVAHTALIGHGLFFSDRPDAEPASKCISSNQHMITSAGYGPLWGLLRRKMSEILHTSRIKIYADGRDWVLGILIDHLYTKSQSSNDGSVVAKDSFQFSLFCLVVLMCFGEKLDEKSIREIEAAQRNYLLHVKYLNVFVFFPNITKYIFRKRWLTAVELRRKMAEIYSPLIKVRREHKKQQKDSDERFVYSYLDSILDIKLEEEGGRNLTDDEIVSLCWEFLHGGTNTTSTTFEWIMAELVKNQEIQKKLIEEITSIVDGSHKTVKEEDLQKMPYLKAVILEGLRRHPPGHFVLPHAVTEEIEFAGYVIPKNASVNFMVAEMGWDEKVWKDPMEFKPERFLEGGEGEWMDITGSREIMMMPFGVGRRICPGIGLAMLHLEYFVANMVREFEWKAVEGDEVNLAEKLEFTAVMKNPLRAKLIPRRK